VRYDFACDECKIIFEVQHGIHEKPEVVCPQCKKPAQRRYTMPEVYVRGYGWCDKKGAQRDMNLWKLNNEDPYARIRPPGDKSDLADKLRKGGKRATNKQHFAMGLKKKGK